MEEYLDVLDEQGNTTGRSETYENVHKLSLLHRTVHAWFLNSKRQLLLQMRSNDKKAYAGHWDISAAGHVSSGETSLEAAQKETREELGLDLAASEFVFLFSIRQPIIVHSPTFIDNEFNDAYLVRRDIDITSLKLQAEEVAEVRWIDIPEFEQWIKGKKESLVPHEEEYGKLLAFLKNNT